MAFSGDKSPFDDKRMLIKAIQTLNQHLPGKRLSLSELLAMDRPGIKGKDNSFYIIDKAELELISNSLPRFLWSRLKLPLLIEMSTDFGGSAARIQGDAEVEAVGKILNKRCHPGTRFLIIYMPEVRELRRKLPTATQYVFVASLRDDQSGE